MLKRFTALLLALLLVFALTACASKGVQKEIIFEVTHADGSVKTYTIQTEAKTLAEALTKEGLISEDAQSPGLYNLIDGELADWSDGEAWWCISRDGTSLSVGMQDTIIADGEHYEAVFTRGFTS